MSKPPRIPAQSALIVVLFTAACWLFVSRNAAMRSLEAAAVREEALSLAAASRQENERTLKAEACEPVSVPKPAIVEVPDIRALEQALDHHRKKEYADAEAFALVAHADAMRGHVPDVSQAIRALEAAGFAAREQFHFSAAVEHLRKAVDLTSRDRDPLEWARVQFALAYMLDDVGKPAEVREILEPVIALRQRLLGAEHPQTLASRNNLAVALEAQGKHDEAEPVYRAVYETRNRLLGPEHRSTLLSRSNLAGSLYWREKLAQAEAEHRECIAIETRVLGPEHPDTLASRSNLAAVLWAQRATAEADAEYRDVIAAQERVLGREHPDTVASRVGWASVLHLLKGDREAEPEYRAVLASRQRALGEGHLLISRMHERLGTFLLLQRRVEEAHVEALAAYEGLKKVLGEEDSETMAARDLVEWSSPPE